jgi:hypothetical protein
MDLGPDVRSAIEAAIETATRVDITPDMIRDARRASYPMTEADMRRLLVDAFRAAGFEVER